MRVEGYGLRVTGSCGGLLGLLGLFGASRFFGGLLGLVVALLGKWWPEAQLPQTEKIGV